MGDRTSSTRVGEFTVHTDRDHRGRFRGRQAMGKNFRGWHYHVQHPRLSQKEILDLLEAELERMGAASEPIFKRGEQKEVFRRNIAIGTVEMAPSAGSLWQLGGRETVLWISRVTGSLHIEANKKEEYARGILTKQAIVKILKRRQKHEI